jgi:hypothetical protein
MTRILRFLKKLKPNPESHCHRCESRLMGNKGSRYCANCLWDELEDPFVQMPKENGRSVWLHKAAFAANLIEREKTKAYLYGAHAGKF